MLELDILLNQFLKEAYPHCSAYEQAQFAELLTVEDTELFAWLMGKSSPKDKNIKKIIELIKNHVARTR
jgi:antitoxin CptB